MSTFSPPVPHQTIGILGGMGPVSTAHFYQEIIRLCQKNYGASQDEDFPAMMIYSLPLKDWGTVGFKDVDSVRAQLVEGVKILEKSGADFIVIPCNTVHYVFEKMQAAVSVPILNLIELVIDAAIRRGWKTVGVMGTETTIRYGNYVAIAEHKGLSIVTVTEEEQEKVTEVIGNVESGKESREDTIHLRMVGEALQAQGVDGVVLGCTELPVVLEQKDTNVPIIDSSFVLAEAAVRRAYGEKKRTA